MQNSYICVGGPLQGRSFTEPPAGYSRTSIERGFHQGQRYVWEYDGTDCLDELLAAAVRYGKFRDQLASGETVDRLCALMTTFTDPIYFDQNVDNEPFAALPMPEPKA